LPDLADATPGTSEGQSRKWSMMRCKTLGHTDKVVSVTYAPNRGEFASGSNDIRIWTKNHDNQGTSWSSRADWSISQLACLSYSIDGTLLAAGSYHDIRLWDANTAESRGSLKGHVKFVTTLASSPNNNTMASGSKDKNVLLWDSRMKAKLGRPLVGHKGMITSVAFSPGGEVVASASSDKTVRLWDIRAGQCISQLSGFADKVMAVSFSPDGQYIAAASDDRTICRWNAQTFDKIGTPLLGHQAAIKCLAFSADSTQIASGSMDAMIRIWDAPTGANVGLPLEGHKGAVESIAFSPDGDEMVSGSRDKTVKVWSARRD
jgi:WD40 repeat protein